MSTELMSRRRYALYRGCSEGAVRKALQDGRITEEPGGGIDPAKADAAWAANTRERTQGAHHGTQGARTSTAAGTHQPDDEPEAKESKAEAERRKEVALANLREMQVAKEAGELVERAAVSRAWFTVARSARDRLQSLRDRLALRLGLSSDQAAIVADELRDVLATLAKEVPGLGEPLPEPVDI